MDGFRSRQIPTYVEIETLESFCQQEEKEMDRCIAEMDRLHDSIAAFGQNLQESVQRSRTFISSIRKEPTEIWVDLSEYMGVCLWGPFANRYRLAYLYLRKLVYSGELSYCLSQRYGRDSNA